MQQVRDNKTEK